MVFSLCLFVFTDYTEEEEEAFLVKQKKKILTMEEGTEILAFSTF